MTSHQVTEEITKLIEEIQRLGTTDCDYHRLIHFWQTKTNSIFRAAEGRKVVKFGVLVRDDRCANIFEGIVGTLRAAKVGIHTLVFTSPFRDD